MPGVNDLAGIGCNATVTIVKTEEGHSEPFETVTLVYEGGELKVSEVVRHYESASIPESSRASLGEKIDGVN